MAKRKIKTKQYIYIVKASNETPRCKIGKTKKLDKRLKALNNMTGNSIDIVFKYMFSAEVADMTQVENDMKKKFSHNREINNKEIYML